MLEFLVHVHMLVWVHQIVPVDKCSLTGRNPANERLVQGHDPCPRTCLEVGKLPQVDKFPRFGRHPRVDKLLHVGRHPRVDKHLSLIHI